MCLAADEPTVPKRAAKTKARAQTPVIAETHPNTAIAAPVVKQQKIAGPTEPTAPASEQSPDELAIRQTDDAFAKAYNQREAGLVSAHFTTDAEYVDELGNVSQGRAAIEKSLAEFFTQNPASKLQMTIDSIRFISPGVAIEDGRTTITHSDDADAIETLYTTLHVKTDGKWLAASIRDHAPKNHVTHSSQLEKLSWLIGDWVDEGHESLVTFSCQPVDKGNFLLRKFTVLISGQESMSGTQRIGWDPLTGKLRAWIFDSEGGHAEGTWHRDGDKWILKSTGVTADGQPASSTSIYTFVNAHSMTWQSVDHEIAGVQLPDSEVVTIVRQAPIPVPVIAAEVK
jgi:uncharacterized protein (TIGR02246 family)